MNLVSNILFICAFIFMSLIIGVPGLDSKNLIQNKIFLFVSLFTFQLLLQSVHKLRFGCININVRNILSDSLLVGTSTIIGYSLFIDMLNMSETRDTIIKYTENKFSHALIISLIISAFIFLSKITVHIVSGSSVDECVQSQ